MPHGRPGRAASQLADGIDGKLNLRRAKDGTSLANFA
jgi:hypothetical protein